MNLRQKKGFFGEPSNNSVSNLAMKIFAYEGAILVPIAVPCIWR